MLQAKPRVATYADIQALPPHIVGEIAHGVLHTQPRPTPRHSHAAGGVFGELRDQFGKRRLGDPSGWVFLIEPELHLGAHILVPDIAGWRRERLPKLPETVGIATPPDWVCEVLSPSTQKFDRTDKLALYGEHGVANCWLVDPNIKTLEVFARVGNYWQLAATFKDAEPVTAPPFEALTFPLDTLWPD